MNFDKDKVDDMTLALLYLVICERYKGNGGRAWKSFDWDTLNRLHEMVEEERTNAAGRARVARDAMDMSEVNLKEAEMNALADQALADFAAAEGISVATDAPAPQASTARNMGGSTPSSESQG